MTDAPMTDALLHSLPTDRPAPLSPTTGGRLAGPLPVRSGRLIAIASGKGGVGKTWLAVTLSHALALRGQRVLLVDGDLGLANVDIQLGLMPKADIGSVADGRLRLDAAVMHVPAGFHVLAGRSGSGSLAGLAGVPLARVLDALHEAANRYDAVILDLGAGLDAAVRRLAIESDGMLLVATDEPTSLTDAYAVLKLYVADQGDLARVRVVVNSSASRGAGERTYATLSRACATFLGASPSLAGIVHRDDRVRDAIRRQTPLLTRHPATQAARDVEAIALMLMTP